VKPPVPIVAIAGRKGGTGKTALCLGLAAHFFRADQRRVLVVDLDPQGSASLALGAEANGEHLADVLNGTAAPEPAAIACGLLLAGGPALASVADPRPLRDALADLMDWADLVLVDCPPGHPTLDRLAMEAVGRAGAVLVAMEPHRMAIAGAARVLDEARALCPSPRCAGVLGRLDERRGLDRAAPELLAGAFNATVLTIHQDTALAAALNAGGLPPAHGRAAADLRAVADWLDKDYRWKWKPKDPNQ
jgi:chromosome partitioning protein